MGKSERKLRVGILGGTFDPIHAGHLVLAETARVELGLDKVLFIPAARPPHKKRRIISDEQVRYRMIKSAVSGNRYFKVSRIELDKPGVSYTVETLLELKKIYPDSELFFIIGSDALPELTTWKSIDKIMTLCRFAVATRPSFEARSLTRRGMMVLNGPFLDISGSEIRRLCREGRAIRYLVPEKVYSYIEKYKLYR